ncbi:hypothetical protein GCM10023170_088270 [Phytohabitans houttuyneae]|uniref:Uncharacterized protein n=1 Tax=Phytohabitans houttuyneae TaxID=1076126 RepID=A0A6V8KIY1_9ACTN|nr:hypothetical protein Phou_061060 [Phytohabitans houttuyneae]
MRAATDAAIELIQRASTRLTLPVGLEAITEAMEDRVLNWRDAWKSDVPGRVGG